MDRKKLALIVIFLLIAVVGYVLINNLRSKIQEPNYSRIVVDLSNDTIATLFPTEEEISIIIESSDLDSEVEKLVIMNGPCGVESQALFEKRLSTIDYYESIIPITIDELKSKGKVSINLIDSSETSIACGNVLFK